MVEMRVFNIASSSDGTVSEPPSSRMLFSIRRTRPLLFSSETKTSERRSNPAFSRASVRSRNLSPFRSSPSVMVNRTRPRNFASIPSSSTPALPSMQYQMTSDLSESSGLKFNRKSILSFAIKSAYSRTGILQSI